MKNVKLRNGKIYIEDDRWVTIRGNHVLIKENINTIQGFGGKKKDFSNLASTSGAPTDKEGGVKKTSSFDYNKVNQSDVFLMQLTNKLKEEGVQYDEVKELDNPLSEEKIIEEIRGADKTHGSCFSVALAYIGQKMGLNVHDFRGGEGRKVISENCIEILKVCSNGNYIECGTVKNSLQKGLDLLKKIEVGKEYFFGAGTHASIIRKDKQTGKLQYLYLQDSKYGNWWDFEVEDYYDTEDTLRETFNCVRGKTTDYYSALVEVENLKNDKTRLILGYINTQKGKERVRI